MKKVILFLFMVITTVCIARQIIYITPKSKKYHSIRSCKTLSKSKNIIEIDISKVGNRTPCKVCY